MRSWPASPWGEPSRGIDRYSNPGQHRIGRSMLRRTPLPLLSLAFPFALACEGNHNSDATSVAETTESTGSPTNVSDTDPSTTGGTGNTTESTTSALTTSGDGGNELYGSCLPTCPDGQVVRFGGPGQQQCFCTIECDPVAPACPRRLDATAEPVCFEQGVPARSYCGLLCPGPGRDDACPEGAVCEFYYLESFELEGCPELGCPLCLWR